MEKTINIFDHFESVINRLSNQIQERYKVGFRFFSPQQWEELEISGNIPVSSSPDPINVSVVVNDNDTFLPVTINGELACVVKLQNTLHLTGAELSQISTLVDSMVGGTADLVRRVENLDTHIYLKTIEINDGATLSSTESMEPSNVIPMEKFSYLRRDTPLQTNMDQESIDPKILSDLPILIHAQTRDQIFRISHEIYIHTKKLASLQLSDLGMEREDLTLEFLKSLGNICLVIPEITELSRESVDVIMEHILAQQPDDNEGLLIIFGSTSSASELINKRDIPLNFYKLISQSRLNHNEIDLTQDQLALHLQGLLRSQKDLQVLTLLSQMGLSAFNVDDLV